MQKTKVAFDVDGTLIYFQDDSPRFEVIALFKVLQGLGCEMYIWSGGGQVHAERVRDRLGLEAQVVEKWSFIPDIAVDDEEFRGKVNIPVTVGRSRPN